jgi:hypothetical protein
VKLRNVGERVTGPAWEASPAPLSITEAVEEPYCEVAVFVNVADLEPAAEGWNTTWTVQLALAGRYPPYEEQLP